MTSRTKLAPADHVKFSGDRRWWTVREADERFVILTRQAEFKPKGTPVYTIIDWERGLRGPCDQIGQGWGVDEPDGCASLLRALNYQLEVWARLVAGEKSVVIDEVGVEVSYRNNVPIEIVSVRLADPLTES